MVNSTGLKSSVTRRPSDLGSIVKGCVFSNHTRKKKCIKETTGTFITACGTQHVAVHIQSCAFTLQAPGKSFPTSPAFPLSIKRPYSEGRDIL